MSSHRRDQTTLFVTLVSITVAGCTPEAHRYIRFPDFFHPGPAGFQRAEAVRHDPYLLDDVGPEVVGGRPPDYQRPLNEVDRARMGAPRPPVLQPVPVPTVPGFAPTVVTPPVVISPLPPTPPPQPVPFQLQQRSPY